MNFLLHFFKLTPTQSIWLNTTFLSFNFFTHHVPQPIFFQLKYFVFINFQLNISELGTAQPQLVRNLLLCLSVSPPHYTLGNNYFILQFWAVFIKLPELGTSKWTNFYADKIAGPRQLFSFRENFNLQASLKHPQNTFEIPDWLREGFKKINTTNLGWSQGGMGQRGLQRLNMLFGHYLNVP